MRHALLDPCKLTWLNCPLIALKRDRPLLGGPKYAKTIGKLHVKYHIYIEQNLESLGLLLTTGVQSSFTQGIMDFYVDWRIITSTSCYIDTGLCKKKTH